MACSCHRVEKNLSVATKRFHSLLRPKSGPEAAWRQVPSTEPREVGIRSGAGCRAFEERRREKNTGRARRGAGGDSGGWLKTTGMIHPYMKKYGGRNSHCIIMFFFLKKRE